MLYTSHPVLLGLIPALLPGFDFVNGGLDPGFGGLFATHGSYALPSTFAKYLSWGISNLSISQNVINTTIPKQTIFRVNARTTQNAAIVIVNRMVFLIL